MSNYREIYEATDSSAFQQEKHKKLKQNIFLVFKGNYSWREVVGVFSDKLQAEQFKKLLDKKNDLRDFSIDIEETYIGYIDKDA